MPNIKMQENTDFMNISKSVNIWKKDYIKYGSGRQGKSHKNYGRTEKCYSHEYTKIKSCVSSKI